MHDLWTLHESVQTVVRRITQSILCSFMLFCENEFPVNSRDNLLPWVLSPQEGGTTISSRWRIQMEVRWMNFQSRPRILLMCRAEFLEMEFHSQKARGEFSEHTYLLGHILMSWGGRSSFKR